MPHTNPTPDTTYDTCSLMAAVAEGCFFHRLLNHSNEYPSETNALMLAALPFCALAVHDQTRFVRRCFDPGFKLDTQAVNRLRNQSKSLSSSGVTFDEYTENAERITKRLACSFKNHRGVMGSLLNAIQPDTGITLYNGMPITTTYCLTRYVDDEGSEERPIDWETMNQVAGQLAYDIGCAAAVSHEAVVQLHPDPMSLRAKRFETEAIDCHYSALPGPLKSKGINNRAALFMLSEVLCQLGTITALRDARFFDDFLFLKYGTAALLAGTRSIAAFANHVMPKPQAYGCSREGALMISTLVPRPLRRGIERAEPLRNGLMHFNMAREFPSIALDDAPEVLLDACTVSSTGMDSSEYFEWLDASIAEVRMAIADAIELPSPNSFNRAW